MTEHERELAKNCYGYGRWDAPYWFIGPEQGQDKNEDGIESRYRAFMQLENDGLCDCRQFHEALPKNNQFVRNRKGKIPAQATWNYQMALLLAYLEEPSDLEARQNYQSSKWGSVDSQNGATCVVELRGLPAHSNKESLNQDEFLEGRIAKLREKLEAHPPEFVVFYGTSEAQNWAKIAEVPVVHDGFVARGNTLFAHLPHPTAWQTLKRSHDDWRAMGKKLREYQAII